MTYLEVKRNVEIEYEEGEILDVVSGPFTGYKAEVVSVPGDKIKCQLDMFDRNRRKHKVKCIRQTK